MLALLNSQPEAYLQEQLETVLNSMPIAVSWANLTDATILFQNRKFKETFGYDFGEHLSVAEWIDKTYVDSAQVKRAVDTWTPHFQTQSIVPIEIEQVEVDVLCKDGSIKTCLHSGMIIPTHGWALAIFNDISERKRYERKIEKVALEDDLTKLSNRRAFNKELSRSLAYAKRHESNTALLLIDLDDFKGINDSFGHDIGDLALIKTAENIQAHIREEDFPCRLGGDEFGVILNMNEENSNAIEVAERIIESFAQELDLDGNRLTLKISVGIAVFPHNSAEVNSLYKKADQALYRAKSKGKGCWSK